MRQKNKTSFVLIAAIIAVGGGWWYMSSSQEAESSQQQGQQQSGMPVEGVAAQNKTISQVVEAVGTLASNESVIIRPEIAGRVEEILFVEGQPVAKGEKLVALDGSIYRAELKEAQASLTLSETNYKRASELYKKGTGTERALDEALAQLNADQARVALAKTRLEKMTLKAPFEGIIGLRHVSEGDYVTVGQDIVNLEDIQTIKVDFKVAETRLPEMMVGQEVKITVDALPDETYTGQIYAINPRVSEMGRSLTLRARIPNNNLALKPGLFARVNVIVNVRENSVVVPEEAIMPDKKTNAVYKVVDGKAQRVEVKLGIRQNGNVEVTSGLEAGDIVITAGQMKVGPGSPVSVIRLDKKQTEKAGMAKPKDNKF